MPEAEIDPDLVQRALNATNEEPDQLPILQHAMMRCWERAFARRMQELDHRPHLKIDDYKTVGGVEQALSVHANEILKDLAKQPDPTTIGLQLATKRVFQALTETDQEGRSVRRPQRFDDLLQYVRPDDASEDRGKSRLRVWLSIASRAMTAVFYASSPAETDDRSVDADSISSIIDNSIIDIGHEALIRRWDRLEGKGKENWIREEQEDAEQYRGLLRYANAGSTIPPEDLTDWKSGGPNASLIVFGLNGTPGIMKPISKRFVIILRGAGSRRNAAIEEHQRNESRIDRNNGQMPSEIRGVTVVPRTVWRWRLLIRGQASRILQNMLRYFIMD